METSESGAGVSRRIQLSGARVAALIVTALLAALILAASAQAYVPGKIAWVRTSGTAAHERGFDAIAKAPNGQFYGAGWVTTSASKGDDILVVKYGATGRALWSRTWDGGGGTSLAGDWAGGAASDSKGNLYVAGSKAGAVSYDIVTIKYGASGARKWVQTWAGEATSSDEPQAVAVDAQGNVIVAGVRYFGSNLAGMVVIKYDAAGARKWVWRWEPSPIDPQDGNKWPSDVAVDAAGDVFVAGASYYAGVPQAVAIKLASADGAELQKKTYDAAAGSYCGAVAVRGQVVAITGWAAQLTDQQDALAVKFDRDLTEQWRVEYADPRGVTARDFGEDVAIGAHGNLFVAGYSNFPPPGGSGFYDSALVLKVNGPGLSERWAKRYKPSGMGADAEHLVLDGSDDLYVGGYVDTDTSEENMLLLKYSPSLARKWSRTWHDTGKDDDWVGGLVLGGTKAVYVAGGGTAKGGYDRAVAMRIDR